MRRLLWIATGLAACGTPGIDPVEDPSALFQVEPEGEIQFGDASVGGEAAWAEVTVTNLSEEVITLQSAEVSGNAEEAFSVPDDPTPLRLQNAQVATLQVQFQPEFLGNHTALLTLVIDSSDTVEAERRLLGQGVR